MGLTTALGLAPKGFFIPYRYAGRMPGPDKRPPYASVVDLFRAAEPDFRTLLAGIDGYAADLVEIGRLPPPEPRWAQDWFPRLDPAVAYTIVRAGRPQRIVEVGSGHSTRFLARAIGDGGFEGRITAVDPAPRAVIEGLSRVELLRAPVQEAGVGIFDVLQAGDVLFIDSSHVLMPGSDVDLLLNRVLPRLPAGVLVHIHDQFLPDDYPENWAWRGYHEQLGVIGLLTGGAYQPVFASHYVATRMQLALGETVISRLPLPEGAVESSLWLRKVQAPGTTP